jgi:hypothetical protein
MPTRLFNKLFLRAHIACQAFLSLSVRNSGTLRNSILLKWHTDANPTQTLRGEIAPKEAISFTVRELAKLGQKLLIVEPSKSCIRRCILLKDKKLCIKI